MLNTSLRHGEHATIAREDAHGIHTRGSLAYTVMAYIGMAYIGMAYACVKNTTAACCIAVPRTERLYYRIFILLYYYIL